MRAFAALRDEQRDFELRPWLFRIAHNEAISALRRRRPTEELDRAAGLGGDDLAQHVLHRERLAQLRVDLGDLPERQRAALVLRELSGLVARRDRGGAGLLAALGQADDLRGPHGARASAPRGGQCRVTRSSGAVRRRPARAEGQARAQPPALLPVLHGVPGGARKRPAELAALAPPLPVAAGRGAAGPAPCGDARRCGRCGDHRDEDRRRDRRERGDGGRGWDRRHAGPARRRCDRRTSACKRAARRGRPRGARAAGTPSWSPPARAGLGTSSRALDQAQGGTGRSQAGRRAGGGASVAQDGRAIPGPGAAAGHQPGGGAGTASENAKHARTPAAATSQRGRRPARTPASSTSRGSGKPATSTTSARRRPAGTPTGPAAAAKRERPAARGGGAAATGSPGTAQRSASRGGEPAAQPQAPQAHGAGPAVPASAGRPGDPAAVPAASGVPSGPPAAGGRPK